MRTDGAAGTAAAYGSIGEIDMNGNEYDEIVSSEQLLNVESTIWWPSTGGAVYVSTVLEYASAGDETAMEVTVKVGLGPRGGVRFTKIDAWEFCHLDTPPFQPEYETTKHTVIQVSSGPSRGETISYPITGLDLVGLMGERPWTTDYCPVCSQRMDSHGFVVDDHPVHVRVRPEWDNSDGTVFCTRCGHRPLWKLSATPYDY